MAFKIYYKAHRSDATTPSNRSQHYDGKSYRTKEQAEQALREHMKLQNRGIKKGYWKPATFEIRSSPQPQRQQSQSLVYNPFGNQKRGGSSLIRWKY